MRVIEGASRAGSADDPALSELIGAPTWAPEAIERVEAWSAALGPSLRARLGRFFARLSRIHGGRSLATALLAPASTPFLPLIDAIRADVGLAARDPRLASIGAGAVLLYMHVRLQDDLVDEPELVDRGDVFVIEALASASSGALASAVGDAPAFFALHSDVMSAFAETASRELDARGCLGEVGEVGEVGELRARGGRGLDADGAAWIGRKFLPMASPLAAVAFAAKQGDLCAGLVDFVTALGGALQTVNDALNVGDDCAARRSTPLVRSLVGGGRLREGDPPGRARAVLLSDDALSLALCRARSFAAEAERIAGSLGLPRAAAIARGRAAFIDSVPSRLFALCLGGGAP